MTLTFKSFCGIEKAGRVRQTLKEKKTLGILHCDNSIEFHPATITALDYCTVFILLRKRAIKRAINCNKLAGAVQSVEGINKIFRGGRGVHNSKPVLLILTFFCESVFFV